MVEYLLAQPHRCSPMNIFLALHDPSMGRQIQQMRSCLFSELAHEFMGENPDLGCKETRVKLMLACLLSRTDISNLESLHGWIRRVLHTRVQTHGLSLDDCSALWILRRNRDGLAEPKQPETSSKRKQPDAAAAACTPAKPKRRKPKNCHNSYQLFCRWRL
jgi:hypothetical protein